MDGEPLDAEQISAIARLPSREVLYGQLVGMVASPITGLARGLNALLSAWRSRSAACSAEGERRDPAGDGARAGGRARAARPRRGRRPRAAEAEAPPTEAAPRTGAEARRAGEAVRRSPPRTADDPPLPRHQED